MSTWYHTDNVMQITLMVCNSWLSQVYEIRMRAWELSLSNENCSMLFYFFSFLDPCCFCYLALCLPRGGTQLLLILHILQCFRHFNFLLKYTGCPVYLQSLVLILLFFFYFTTSCSLTASFVYLKYTCIFDVHISHLSI